MPSHDEKATRVAIQLGTSSSSNLHNIKKRSRPAHTKRHRAHALDEESESDSGGAQDEPVRHEVITAYGSDASDHGSNDREHRGNGHQSKRHKHHDRKSESRCGQDAPASGNPNGDKEARVDAEEKSVKWGLTINMKGSSSRKDQQASKPRRDPSRSDKEEARNGTHEKSIDDEALDALIGAESKKSKREPRQPNDPDGEPRLEDYRAVPIDDFGATLLRSFGWDGQMRGKVKEVAKHANLTGLGAKDAKGAEDLGSWNQKPSRDSRPVRLEDYQREQSKKRQRLEERQRDSYKEERERERERERGHRRDR